MNGVANRRSSTSTTHEVYERLRGELLSARLKPGARLKISDLCERLEVSLGAVREALSRLTSEGLIVAEPQRGFRVAPISAFELRDLTTVRVEIEAMCLRRAVEAGDVAWEAGLVAAFHTLSRLPERQPGDATRLSDEWASAHHAFHEALVAACDSPWLLRLRELLYAQGERYRRLSAPYSGFRRDAGREHKEIMEAALGRDADLAVSLMSSHLLLTTKILLSGGFAPELATSDAPADGRGPPLEAAQEG